MPIPGGYEYGRNGCDSVVDGRHNGLDGMLRRHRYYRRERKEEKRNRQEIENGEPYVIKTTMGIIPPYQNL